MDDYQRCKYSKPALGMTWLWLIACELLCQHAENDVCHKSHGAARVRRIGENTAGRSLCDFGFSCESLQLKKQKRRQVMESLEIVRREILGSIKHEENNYRTSLLAKGNPLPPA